MAHCTVYIENVDLCPSSLLSLVYTHHHTLLMLCIWMFHILDDLNMCSYLGVLFVFRHLFMYHNIRT